MITKCLQVGSKIYLMLGIDRCGMEIKNKINVRLNEYEISTERKKSRLSRQKS